MCLILARFCPSCAEASGRRWPIPLVPFVTQLGCCVCIAAADDHVAEFNVSISTLRKYRPIPGSQTILPLAMQLRVFLSLRQPPPLRAL
jgi:hypothetical protein